MKALLLAILTLGGFAPAEIEWNDLDRGAQYACVEASVFDAPQCISILRYRPMRFRTEIANDPAADADSTSALISRHGGFAGINASYFNVRTLDPATYVKDDGVKEGETTENELFRADGMVTIKRHKVCIRHFDEASVSKKMKEAISSGPLLVEEGQECRGGEWPADSFFTGRHPRTVIGLSKDGWVYMIVIDGRFNGRAAGMTIHETAQIAIALGLTEALNLDGGGSSVLWTEPTGALSHPCDNRRYDHYGQRKVPNVIYIK